MLKLHFQKITSKEKENFKIHLFTYLRELGITENEYSYLDSYWVDKNRIPLYLFFGKKKIGFALINDYCLIKKEQPSRSIAEFYIFEKERRNNFGKRIAIQIFNSFRGNWEIRTMDGNIKSEQFWENVISDYTPTFSKLSNHLKWKGSIFCFKSKS